MSLTILLSQIIGYFMRGYSFYHVFNDYRMFVHNLWHRQPILNGTSLDVDTNLPNPKDVKIAEKIRSKINWNDSIVRNYSVIHCQDYFSGYENKYGYCVRFLSLFKHINSKFKYISDAKRDEYFATASETIKVGLAGDCDDHSILMASCMKSIGADIRLVIIEGHIFPEIGFDGIDEFNKVIRAIDKLFHDELKDFVHYHTEGGKYWINLDYSANHPGGPYLNRKVLYVINL
ncbi:MAG: transglutaminase domain-containing protein [Bacteroidota bacterium]